ncbi:MAG: PBSX family phage terminase large subunit [Oscillospiraceae bacterium]|nr:PBSX family phage terminase large subunit [Oscillospiraceae bacterium]
MKFHDFSESQLKALTWWNDSSPYGKMDAIICDGAVRSGKTVCMGLSFFFWSMSRFDGERFGLCGKTVTSLRRNFVAVILPLLRELGFVCVEKVSKNLLTVSFGGRTNDFYLFGGRDESSASLIQGVTFAGVLLDEVALMPRSFVEQAIARCSVEGSKLWFNCNPESPHHWFYTQWIKQAQEKNALYVHFKLEDNPGLTKEVMQRYARMFSGVFHKRFILGQWIAAQGLVYDFFTPEMAKKPPEGQEADKWVISCDYGTANPCSFGLWGDYGGTWYRVKEYYFDSRREGFQKTDWEYVSDLKKLAGGRSVLAVVVDPSAASFIEALRREGFSVVKAENDVLSGIRTTSSLLKSGKIVISPDCEDALREFSLYCWQDQDIGRDAPKKENDHAMDEIRYFAATVAARETVPVSVAAGVWRK